jgi:Methyltransferase domain
LQSRGLLLFVVLPLALMRRFRRVVRTTYAQWRYAGDDVQVLLSEQKAVRFIRECIRDARKERSKLLIPPGEKILRLAGMSSAKNRHLLNNLCSLKGARYLEIGVWKGSTFASAGYRNQIKMTAIDNWSQFDGPKPAFEKTCKELVRNEMTFFDADCFKVPLEALPEKFHVYFYDGDHSYESQYQAFLHFDSVLESTFIAIVDDYNADHVQQGTQDAFRNLGYKVLFEEYLPTPEKANADESSWWNGMYVALVKKRAQA